MPRGNILKQVQLRQLLYDAVIMISSFVLYSFAFSFLQRPITNTARDPLTLYINSILLSLIVFSIAFYCAVPVYSYFKKIGSLNIVRLVNDFVFYLLIFIVLTIYFFTHMILSLPPVSAFILFISSSIFGFSFGIELRLEQDRDIPGKFEKTARKFYDRSIAGNLPYLLCILAGMVPIEIFLFPGELTIVGIVILGGLLFPVYYAGKFLAEKVFYRVEITRGSGTVNFIAYNIIPVVVLIAFLLWEHSIIISIYGTTDRDIFSFSFFFILAGLVPIRLLYVFQPGTHVLNKIICLAALAVYCYNKYTMMC